MRGSTTKKINHWCKVTWDRTPENEREGFKDFAHYVNRVKSQWKEDVNFKNFIEMTYQQGIV